MRKVLSLLVVTLTVCILTVNASAEWHNQSNNLEKMNRTECNSIIQSISTSIINNNAQSLSANSDYFEPQAYKSVIDFINRDSVKGSIIDSIIEFTYPDYSSTGDSVVMANYKLSIGNKHNILYLFEFHINKDGKIYGFNAWEY
jgi:hypothetical protein